MKPGPPVLRSTRLLDQVCERVRYLHYSLSTEKDYLHWVCFFICWSGRSEGMRRPSDLSALEVDAFLTMLAPERRVLAATHDQALRALLLLTPEVLPIDLPWMNGVNRP